MKIYTKKGDEGETSLVYGVRTAKCDPRCEAYGTIDEAVSMLGLAKNFCQTEVKDVVFDLQQNLFIVGTELATPLKRYPDLAAKGRVVKAEMVQRLENLIDNFEARIDMPREFIIPGVCVSSAALDVARAIIRRAERKAVVLKEAGQLANEEVLKYLNRLSDLVFTLARYEEKVINGDNPGD